MSYDQAPALTMRLPSQDVHQLLTPCGSVGVEDSDPAAGAQSADVEVKSEVESSTGETE